MEEKEGMLKITISKTAIEERWTLHGRLVAPCVNELKACWRRHTAQLRGEGAS